MTLSWILIANASVAQLFKIQRPKLFNHHPELELIQTFDHSSSRKKTRDLMSDRLGHLGQGTCECSNDPHLQESDKFAGELAQCLSCKRDDYQDLIIVAPPRFTGLLKKHMPAAVRRIVSCYINKDFTRVNNQSLPSVLKAQL